MNNNNLSIKDKFLLVFYIILLIIPFGLSLAIFIYAILFYIFKVPLKREKELLTYVSSYIDTFIKKIIK
jgi:hypothetical protein|tara:strand:- start:43783 stop:43989 length:207 start_codon:yes stop_codon:yes gene_type:complete